MRKNWGGPLIAAVAQGTTLRRNRRGKRKGNSAKIARNTRYQVSGATALAGSNHWKCQVHSRAVTQANPMAAIHSIENNRVTPRSSTTSSNARPKRGEGSANGNR